MLCFLAVLLSLLLPPLSLSLSPFFSLSFSLSPNELVLCWHNSQESKFDKRKWYLNIRELLWPGSVALTVKNLSGKTLRGQWIILSVPSDQGSKPRVERVQCHHSLITDTLIQEDEVLIYKIYSRPESHTHIPHLTPQTHLPLCTH